MSNIWKEQPIYLQTAYPKLVLEMTTPGYHKYKLMK